MGHFTVLIIIPRDVYLKGFDTIVDYIHETMEPFKEGEIVKPHIVMMRPEFEAKFQKEMESNPQLTRDQYANDLEYSFNSEGHLTSTSNPLAMYDWYSIGGRSDGVLTGRRDPRINPFTMDLFEQDSLKNNMISMQTFREDYHKTGEAYGFIIDTAGKLHHRRCLRTWAELKSEAEWKPIYEEILKTNLDGYIVNLDCHC